MPSKWNSGLRLLMVLLLGSALAWTGRTLWRNWFPGSPSLIVLLADSTPWRGFTPSQEKGLLILMADSLEISAGLPVVLGGDLLGEVPPEASVVRLKGSRTQGTFTVDATLSRGSHRLKSWRASGVPLDLFRALLEPFRPQGQWAVSLIPAEPEDFGTLLEITGLESDWDTNPQLKPAHDLLKRVPGCASGWLALAGLEHRGLVLSADSNPMGQEGCQDHFQRAIAMLPSYPRAIHHYAIYLTDIGNQREALEQLEPAIRTYPRVGQLRSALAYAARTAGLLEVGIQAVESRDRLQGVTKTGSGLAENVHLYRGDFEQFRVTLGQHSLSRAEPIMDFYRGYLYLLKGERGAALTAFQQVADHPGSKVLFEDLAKVYALALEGRAREALQILDPLREQRLRLRVPDGEYTFKLAEAYGFLGRNDDALLVAERAFSQGFGCTRWYEATPLLAAIRDSPRWRGLIQHLQDRQALLEARFPANRFR